ncbi:MAG: TetR/AcrR family transcriptional regulator, partial [Mycobacteriaceae bacterium]|nr:TetR/AcrR family transcriptional regulator [Mycobacteriaceae bacterium]
MAVQTVYSGRGRPPAAHGDARERIIAAARRVFNETGYAAATYQGIAERAGVTRPAVNHHFRHKRDLYRAVMEQTNDQVVQAGMERARDESTLVAQLRAFIEAAIEVDSKDHAGAAFLATSILDSQRHPELRTEGDGLAGLRRFLKEMIANAITSGELPAATPIAEMADALLSILWGMGFYAG